MLLLDVVAKSWPHPLLSSLKSHSIYGVVVTQASYRSKGYSITAKYRLGLCESDLVWHPSRIPQLRFHQDASTGGSNIRLAKSEVFS